MTENNREFEQTPAILQLFHQYFKGAQKEGEGEYLSPMEILNYLQKKSSIPLSSSKVYHFGRLLQNAVSPPSILTKGLFIK